VGVRGRKRKREGKKGEKRRKKKKSRKKDARYSEFFLVSFFPSIVFAGLHWCDAVLLRLQRRP
jgi:hypothetical protein